MNYIEVGIAKISIDHIEKLQAAIRDTNFENIEKYVDNTFLRDAAIHQIRRLQEQLQGWGVKIPESSVKEPTHD